MEEQEIPELSYEANNIPDDDNPSEPAEMSELNFLD